MTWFFMRVYAHVYVGRGCVHRFDFAQPPRTLPATGSMEHAFVRPSDAFFACICAWICSSSVYAPHSRRALYPPREVRSMSVLEIEMLSLCVCVDRESVRRFGFAQLPPPSLPAAGGTELVRQEMFCLST